jgi:hypothetical protein
MSQRKRNESILLAILAIVSILPLRLYVESWGWFLAELGTMSLLLSLAIVAKSFDMHTAGRSRRWANFAAVLLGVTPIIFVILARGFGSPVAFEMFVLTAFGSASLAIAVSAASKHFNAMSLVMSGFLVVFSTSISDFPSAVWFAIVWMTVCVWHLVANNWERLDLCLPDSVRPTVGVRPVSVLLAVVLCLVGTMLVRDRFGESNRLTFGFMPVSGGSKWSDLAARSGVGTGDAAIAAKDHAESFGAVESEIFLESTEPTLFDMFNDTIGEPKMKRNEWERSQGMKNDNVIPMHHEAAKSEKGGSSFSTDRMPPTKHRHFSDTVDDAVIQWDGPSGIRLAMERFDTFDGVNWTNSANLADDELLKRKIDNHVWFFDRKLQNAAFGDADAVEVNLLKVLRLDTTRLPAPMMTAGLHIKDIDRQDFFGIDADGSLFMPGREKVPPLTVVNLASLKVTEDELIGSVAAYADLKSIVNDLRSNYTLDRNTSTSSDKPVDEFLRTRRGGDHMFATVAALKAREIGLQSRIVTGFYIRPDSYDLAAGHACVTPDDVHVWTEIRLDSGRWFEIEPTPSYREPVYTPSMWLVAKRFIAAYWSHGTIIAGGFALLFLTRLIWVDWLLAVVWSLSWPFRGQQQLHIAMQIVEIRAKLIGIQRPVGTPQRDWMELLVASDCHLKDLVREFCNDADRSIFGGRNRIDRRCLNGVVRGLSTRRLKQSLNEVTV